MSDVTFLSVSVEASLHPRAQGSRTMQELVEIQDAFKKNYINEHDVQLLYASWNQRLKDGNYSASMKERQVINWAAMRACKQQKMHPPSLTNAFVNLSMQIVVSKLSSYSL